MRLTLCRLVLTHLGLSCPPGEMTLLHHVTLLFIAGNVPARRASCLMLITLLPLHWTECPRGLRQVPVLGYFHVCFLPARNVSQHFKHVGPLSSEFRAFLQETLVFPFR